MVCIISYWQVIKGEYEMARKSIETWVFDVYILVDSLSWVLDWLYISMYMRIAFIVPLTFCLQSDQVKEKRKSYKKMLVVIDVIAYCSICSFTACEYAMKLDQLPIRIVQSLFCIVLTIALCLTLQKIRKYTLNFASCDSIKGRGLILAHQTMFILASVVGTLLVIFKAIEHYEYNDSDE